MRKNITVTNETSLDSIAVKSAVTRSIGRRLLTDGRTRRLIVGGNRVYFRDVDAGKKFIVSNDRNLDERQKNGRVGSRAQLIYVVCMLRFESKKTYVQIKDIVGVSRLLVSNICNSEKACEWLRHHDYLGYYDITEELNKIKSKKENSK